MSSTTASLVLKGYERDDKTRSINLRIIHYAKAAWIPLNVNVATDEWDKITEQIDKKKCRRYKNINRVNDHLVKKKLDARAVIADLYH